MIITGTQLQTMRRAFSAAFNKALLADPPVSLEQFATSIPMPTSVVELGMIKAIPGLRRWVGDRIFHRLAAHGFTMQAVTYEDGIEVERSFIEDDNLGLFLSSMEQLGIQTRQHPDDLLAALLVAGTGATSLAYDGVPFFSTTHPERNAAGVLGNGLGSNLDDKDRQRAYAAEVQALEQGEPGEPVGWKGTGGGNRHGTIVPGGYYETRGVRCRDYSHTIYVNGRPETARATACRNPDGTWQPVG